MSECGNSLLCYGDLSAFRALLTLGKTGVYTIGLNPCESLLGMAECGNGLLRYEHLIAAGARLTCGKTLLGTGGIGRSYIHLIMTECGREDYVTHTTGRCGLASCFGGRMSLCNGRLLCHSNLVTYGTDLALGVACLCTGSFLSGNNLLGVSKGLTLGSTTLSTGLR